LLCAAGKCWTGVSRDTVQDFYRQLNAIFNSGNINNLFGLDPFPADNTDALVLSAKMSLLQVNIYQQLIMLGSAQGENDTLKSFAATAAAKIGVSRKASRVCFGQKDGSHHGYYKPHPLLGVALDVHTCICLRRCWFLHQPTTIHPQA
jgi:hypothetical protein